MNAQYTWAGKGERSSDGVGVVLHGSGSSAIRMECSAQKATSAGGVKVRDRTGAINVSVAPSVTVYRAVSQYQDQPIEAGVSTHREIAGDDQQAGATIQRAIAVDESESRRGHAARSAAKGSEVTALLDGVGLLIGQEGASLICRLQP